MTLESNILLITRDDNTTNAVNSALSDNKGITLAGICKEVSDIRNYLSGTNIHTVVVDIDPDSSRILYDLGDLLHSYPENYI